MSVKFKADKSFQDYILMIGFIKRPTKSDSKEYYSNKEGNQIKINTSLNTISLMDNKGNTLKSSKEFTSEEIDNFSKSGAI